MPPSNRTDKRQSNLPASCFKKQQNQNSGETHMSMVMVNCPQTGRAIPTGIKSDRESFRRSPVFFGRTHCPICQVDHAWFAQEAWVDEPNAWARRRSAISLV
jgi:hypothetical protein